MKDGNWIPVSKALIKKLPKDRPFSEVEAAFSLQVAYDCNQDVSVAGLAARWMWSRRRTRGFIEEMGAAVSYQKNTSTLQNQRGQIAIQIPDRYRTDTGQIRLIDSKHLSVEADRKRTESGQKADRYRSTIKDPDPNPDKKDIVPFEDFYSLYPKKRDKAGAEKSWKKLKVDHSLFEKIKESLEFQKNSQDWEKENGKYIPYPATWLNNKRWEDEIELKEEDGWQ